MDSWDEVTHRNGNVTGLDLEDTNLMVIIPEIGNLTNLSQLYLTNNSLTSIPQVICDLETNNGTTILKDLRKLLMIKRCHPLLKTGGHFS
ncbi:hypothetical protein ATE84_3270 [Aquimarina sp. MAR_2010_214]|uniref:hypothetical protein n=1 Tax=Aquimarina sp. MAR_2010_214 TaxID=1250026 RepID=UPI000C701801|nr:hypothetical protein [Aquimarina sp. MAR_2010_214]PKV51196.1 hypothetical protein ATE84_3270 [Aquimarina sp. MAR_2010_214]